MAIALEFANVIIPIQTVVDSFPGGLAAYRNGCPNGSYLQDQHLTRVGFMSTAEALTFAQEQEARGIQNIAVIERSTEDLPHWLAMGEQHGMVACWFQGEEASEIMACRDLPMYLCGNQAVECLPGMLAASKIECRSVCPNELVCERDGQCVTIEVLSQVGEPDSVLLLKSDCGRIAGAPDDANLIRDIDGALQALGATSSSK